MSILQNGENSHAHIYLFCKNHYKVTLTTNQALSRILSKIYLLDSEVFTDTEIANRMLDLALTHISNENALTNLIMNLNHNSWHYNIRKYTSFEEALIMQCMSIITSTNVSDIPGKLPEKDYSLFFTPEEILNKK